MKRKIKYNQEFKQMAVEHSRHREEISALAEELDIKQNLLYDGEEKPNKPREGPSQAMRTPGKRRSKKR